MSAIPSRHRDGLRTRAWLKRHRWMRLHVALIAMCCLACLWLSGALLRAAGLESLALRFGLSLAISYTVYLGLLRLWATYLISRHDGDTADGLDMLDLGLDVASTGADAGGSALELVELASGADEGAVVLLPIAAVVVAVLALAALLGTGVTLLFGVEVLLAVSVEVALAALAGGLAWQHQRQYDRGGWLRCALQHTWAGALALLVAGVGLGAALDHWVPQAESLPHAVRLWRAA